MINTVLQHYERFLGQPSRKWTNDLHSFDVCLFENQPFEDCFVYASLGVSNHPLSRPNGVEGAQEVVLLSHRKFRSRQLEDLLFVIGGDVLRNRRALRKGEILGPSGPLVTGATVEAIFCTSPPYLPDDFDEVSQPRPVIVVGLIPITRSEAKYASSHGWKALEEKLYDEQPDILDLERESMNACGIQ